MVDPILLFPVWREPTPPLTVDSAPRLLHREHRSASGRCISMSTGNFYATSKYVVERVNLAMVALLQPYGCPHGANCLQEAAVTLWLAHSPGVGPGSWVEEGK